MNGSMTAMRRMHPVPAPDADSNGAGNRRCGRCLTGAS